MDDSAHLYYTVYSIAQYIFTEWTRKPHSEIPTTLAHQLNETFNLQMLTGQPGSTR